MREGKVKKIVGDRGFGFISVDNGDDVFFHHSECDGQFEQLAEGDSVQFEIGQGPKGPRAERVTRV